MQMEKRKNDSMDAPAQSRSFPWLLVLLAILLGAGAMFAVMAVSSQSSVPASRGQFVLPAAFDGDMNAYATAIYAERTQYTVNAQSGNMEPFAITATYIAGEATLQALPFVQGR